MEDRALLEQQTLKEKTLQAVNVYIRLGGYKKSNPYTVMTHKRLNNLNSSQLTEPLYKKSDG